MNNKEYHKNYSKEYLKNIDKIKEYKEKNIDKIKDYQKEYHKNYDKDYYIKNKERIKQYYENNKNKINEYGKEKFICECGSSYTINHKARHFKSKKHYEFIIKPK